ncbi:hypothetical protein HDU90_005550 [Geranomyces variabilis]|nr:hypothetical protein HDU90_005550 [Geranomyces variabilis]
MDTVDRLNIKFCSPSAFFQKNPCAPKTAYAEYLDEEEKACEELKQREYRQGGTPLSRAEKASLSMRMIRIREARGNAEHLNCAWDKLLRQRESQERHDRRERLATLKTFDHQFDKFGILKDVLEYNKKLLPNRKRKATAEADQLEGYSSDSSAVSPIVTANAGKNTRSSAPSEKRAKITAEAAQNEAPSLDPFMSTPSDPAKADKATGSLAPSLKKSNTTAKAAESEAASPDPIKLTPSDTAKAGKATGSLAPSLKNVSKAAREIPVEVPVSPLEASVQHMTENYTTGVDVYYGECAKLWTAFKKDIKNQAASHNEKLAQRGRHQSILMQWFAVDTAVAEMPVFLGAVSFQEVSKRYATSRVTISRSALRILAAAPLLADITALAASDNVTVPSMLRNFLARSTIEPLPDMLVFSIAGSLFTDTAAAAVIHQVEQDTKLVSVRLAHSLGNSLNPTVKKGVARSDFAVFSPAEGEGVSVNRAGAAILIAEFAASADAFPIHKDLFVITAEAVFESHSLISHLELHQVELARIHILLVSNRILRFGLVQPVYRQGGIFWVLDVHGPEFNLSADLPLVKRLVTALRMASYLKEVVFPDGERLRKALTKDPVPASSSLLPKLPRFIPPQRQPGPCTPISKRAVFP